MRRTGTKPLQPMTPFGTGSTLCAYMRLYIILPDQETVLVNARVTVAGILSALPQEPHLPEAPPTTPRSERRIYLDDWISTPVYDFDTLAPAQTISGPAIVESAMTTVLLRPGERATVTALGWLDIVISHPR